MPVTAPSAVLTLPTAGSAVAPSAVLTLPGAGSATAPSAVLTLPGAGSATAPSAVLTLPGAGSATAPGAVLTVSASGAGQAVDFSDSDNPERDGRYVYLGLFESVIPCWARDDGTTAIVAGVLTGAGLAFIQRENGSGEFVWSLEDGSDWASTSPNTLMTHLTATATRAEEPTPADAGEWFDVLADAVSEGLAFTLTGVLPPLPVLSIPSAGAATAPQAVLSLPSAGAVQMPRMVLRPPGGFPGTVLDAGIELTDGPDGTLTDTPL